MGEPTIRPAILRLTHGLPDKTWQAGNLPESLAFPVTLLPGMPGAGWRTSITRGYPYRRGILRYRLARVVAADHHGPTLAEYVPDGPVMELVAEVLGKHLAKMARRRASARGGA